MPYPYTFGSTDGTITAGGYCSADDVQLQFKNAQLISALDSDELERRIADAAVEIDAALNPIYVTPVSGDAAALNLLRLINARLAGAVVHEILNHRTTKGDQTGAAGSAWRSWAEAMLLDIIHGHIRFFTAPVQNPTELPRFPAGAGAQMNPDIDMTIHPEVGPIFSRTGRGNLSALGDLM